MLDEGELALELRSRVALRVLWRRAAKRGRRPVMRCSSRGLLSLARSTGWETERYQVVARTADVPEAELPSARGSALRVPRLRLPGLRLPALRLPAEQLPALPRVRGVPAVGGVVAAAVALAVLLYPSASVTVVPVTESWQMEVPISVDPALKTADVATAKLPGRAIMREASDTATAPATGKKTVPDGKASGEVVLLNQSEKAVPVPKGATVLAGTVKFAIQADITVPPSRVVGGARSYGMTTVKVQAVTGGLSGNVDRNKIDKIEGPLSTSLTVQNQVALRGGTERQSTYVTEDDRRRLQDSLSRTLSERVAQQAKKELPTGDRETVVQWGAQNPAVVEATFSKAADEEASSVSLTLKVRYGATIFSNDAYNTLVRQLAERDVPRARPGFLLLRDSVRPEPPSVAVVENGVVRLAGRAKATVTPPVNDGQLRAALAGKPVTAARSYLEGLSGTNGYSLVVNNFLPGRMPAMGWRIGVRAKAPAS